MGSPPQLCLECEGSEPCPHGTDTLRAQGLTLLLPRQYSKDFEADCAIYGSLLPDKSLHKAVDLKARIERGQGKVGMLLIPRNEGIGIQGHPAPVTSHGTLVVGGAFSNTPNSFPYLTVLSGPIASCILHRPLSNDELSTFICPSR